ncbi:L2 protein [Papillomaviridae sp. Seabass_c1851]|nr:L2 protein [Papillomaviridae sp. Seabass_c1851]
MKDTKYHFQWDEEEQKWMWHKDKTPILETIFKIASGLTFFGGLGIGSGDFISVAGSGLDGLVPEAIPLQTLGESEIFPAMNEGVIVHPEETVPLAHPEEHLIEVEETSFGMHPENPPKTSTPIKAGRPNINNKAAVYDGDLEIETDVDQVEIKARGTGKDHELVYTKPGVKGQLKSGKTLKHLLWKSVSNIEPEIEMEPLIPNEELEFPDETGEDDELAYFPAPKRQRVPWGGYDNPNPDHPFFGNGKVPKNQVRIRKGKLEVHENGKWVQKKIPRSTVYIKEPPKSETQKKSGKGRGKRTTKAKTLQPAKKKTPEIPLIPGKTTTPLVPILPRRTKSMELRPAARKNYAIMVESPKIKIPKKKKCLKRNARGKCVKYAM